MFKNFALKHCAFDLGFFVEKRADFMLHFVQF